MTAPEPLSASDIERRLRQLPGWSGGPEALERTLALGSFAEAIAFMSACVAGIDRLDHHPTWKNVYNRVEIRLSTADAGHRVTEQDFKLAAHLDEVLTGFTP